MPPFDAFSPETPESLVVDKSTTSRDWLHLVEPVPSQSSEQNAPPKRSRGKPDKWVATCDFQASAAMVVKLGTRTASLDRLVRAIRDKRVYRGDLRVLLCIMDHLNGKSGTAWPGRESISDDVGLSLKAVGDCLLRLRRLGHITWERRGRLHYYTLPPLVSSQDDRASAQPGTQSDAHSNSASAQPSAHSHLASAQPAANSNLVREEEPVEIEEPASKKEEPAPPSGEDAQARAPAPEQEADLLGHVKSPVGPQAKAKTTKAKAAKASAKRRPAKAPFSADWQPGDDVITFGASHGLTEQETRRSFDKCKNWFVHGDGSDKRKTEQGWVDRVRDWIEKDANTKSENATRTARYSGGRSDRHAASFDAAVAAMRDPQADIEAAAAAMMAGRQ